MPVFYIPAIARYKADSFTALTQLNTYISTTPALQTLLTDQTHETARNDRLTAFKARIAEIEKLGALPSDPSTHSSSAISPSQLAAQLRTAVPPSTIFAVEAVTLTGFIADQIRPVLPKTYINCGGGGLGWSGGGALGIKLASDYYSTTPPSFSNDWKSGKFICQIVGDGTFLFSVPGSVYWIAQRYNLPILTIVLNNKGWNAPRRSLLLVHPEGEGSKVDNKKLNISFEPTPDFSGIAKAAAGGRCWAGCVRSVKELVERLPEAVEAVKTQGICAVLEVKLGDDLSDLTKEGVTEAVKAASSG